MELAFKNAQIVAREEVFLGSVLVRDGVIAAVERGPSRVGEDCAGMFLAPGLIDLHTDNLEKHFFPRPQIDWNPRSAAIVHDGACVSVGVTTIYNSLSVGSFGRQVARQRENLIRLAEGVRAARDQGALKADHKLHWRCELSADDLHDELEPLAHHPMTALFSLMDHTPGQRQYRNIDRFLDMWRREGMSEAAIDAKLAEAKDRQSRNVARQRGLVADYARSARVPLAAHDDETTAHVASAHACGATIAEFPVTLEAAQAARACGMAIVMGGPNLIRGGSYSGNVPAAELADRGLLDGFASDYVPRSLIECAFALAAPPHDWPLAKAFATITALPAQALGLHDRGVIEPGLRADLIRVRLIEGLPVVRGAWAQGQRIG